MARVSIEDCLEFMENRFALCTVASHRARLIMEGAPALLKSKNKIQVTALREIAAGAIVSVHKDLDIKVEEAPPVEPEPMPAPPIAKI